jgi:hypothetical protein
MHLECFALCTDLCGPVAVQGFIYRQAAAQDQDQRAKTCAEHRRQFLTRVPLAACEGVVGSRRELTLALSHRMRQAF